ncbi:hypothetical protein E2562_027591 [Oryza meyeriana var. granulata]|uniref:Uncharacterized protein n=1 Tax=Oryza meyeriana var. granulata TaxID=110450 RepID=A0A6G1DR76_9ORYZ|nr:hypothetical protein E2562_027591 [Oryza meyeriana var. granulata]
MAAILGHPHHYATRPLRSGKHIRTTMPRAHLDRPSILLCDKIYLLQERRLDMAVKRAVAMPRRRLLYQSPSQVKDVALHELQPESDTGALQATAVV